MAHAENWTSRLDLPRICARAGVTLTTQEFQRVARDFALEVGNEGLITAPIQRLEANIAAYVRKWVARQKGNAPKPRPAENVWKRS